MKKISYCDLEQAESRTVGAILYRLFGDSAYLDVQESGDSHTLVCRMAWRHLPWPSDFTLENLLSSPEKKFPKDLLAAARAVADTKASGSGMSWRERAKRLTHGTNYYGQPPQMARATGTAPIVVRNFQEAYFDAFPFIKEWHLWVRSQLVKTRSLTTLLGRRRVFFDRPEDQTTINKAVAFEPQSVATGDYMSKGFLDLWRRNLPIKIHKHIHDALAFSYEAKDELTIIPEVCSILSWPITLVAHEGQIAELSEQKYFSRTERELLARLLSLPPRIFSIPVEPKVGWNLGRYSPSNLNGLVKFSPLGDSRKKVPSEKVTFLEHFTHL